MPSSDSHDVIIVGGGPAGSVLAWSLARRGVRVAVVERASFPREKVCGDFVEPGGLRILEAMQCRQLIEGPSRLPITSTRIFIGSEIGYVGDIPYYEEKLGLPPYGYIVPRRELDTHLLSRAEAASATVYRSCMVTGIDRNNGRVRVSVRSGGQNFALNSSLVVGADGTQSIVARSSGLARSDQRYIAISQRAYVEGVSLATGEATICFDDDIFPGYGWLFPMQGGEANVGIGILSETCHRHGLSVPRLFEAFITKLQQRHPGCARMRHVSRPLGGVVKTYGGVGPNYFDGGVLIGDAGSFADPMTGEGITPGMESALLASVTLIAALERGEFDAVSLSRFERDFRSYFDPAMRYLDFCATLLRNRHLREFWLRAGLRGFAKAGSDPSFARIAGATFGGLEVRPLSILTQIWSKMVGGVAASVARAPLSLFTGMSDAPFQLLDELGAWQRGWWRSVAQDPLWTVSWMADVVNKSTNVPVTLWAAVNPRVQGTLPRI
jgi:geranylgeranyl reductase family protein